MPIIEDLDEVVSIVARDMQPHLGEGRVADYIPALARVDPRQFGIAIVACDGRTASAGAAQTPFSIQSISKAFTLVLAINRLDETLWTRVGREPSGSPFNSIVQLEMEKGIPRNPFINAGALVVTDAVIDGSRPAEAITDIAGFMRRLAMDDAVSIDPEVAASEEATGFRNTSLAYFLKSFGRLESPVADVLEVYFNQCALDLRPLRPFGGLRLSGGPAWQERSGWRHIGYRAAPGRHRGVIARPLRGRQFAGGDDSVSTSCGAHRMVGVLGLVIAARRRLSLGLVRLRPSDCRAHLVQLRLIHGNAA